MKGREQSTVSEDIHAMIHNGKHYTVSQLFTLESKYAHAILQPRSPPVIATNRPGSLSRDMRDWSQGQARVLHAVSDDVGNVLTLDAYPSR